jgi:hypothetical protein
MHGSPNVAPERTSHVGVVVLAVIGVALVAAAALGTYESSIATAAAARGGATGGVLKVLQYLPVSTTPIGPLREPLMVARRAALRAGFDRDVAPIDAFDRLRSVPGHDDEARSLLAQYWERKAMLADSPLRRVLYALQARVVDDDDLRRRSAESAIAALGPLRRARHVAEGTVLSSDAHTLVLRGAGWLHVLDRDTGASFDLSDTQASSALVDGRRMVTWGDDMARVWSLDAAPVAPLASFKLLAGEVPLSFAGSVSAASTRGCILTSAGRVWGADDGSDVVLVARGHWLAGSIDETCDGLVLRGERIASYRRRGKAWEVEPIKAADRAMLGARPGGVHAEACAAQAPRCVLKDPSGARSVWDFGVAPRRIYDGIDCEVDRMSPDGTRLMCRESHDGTTLYTEGDDGNWTRTDVVFPALNGVYLQNDGTVCGAIPWKESAGGDRADVAFLASERCGTSGVTERAWNAIRMLPAGTGAVFTYGSQELGAAENTGFFGFDAKGESLAAASNAWFGERSDERLLERDATNSAESKTYELDGAPFDPAPALDASEHPSAVQIDDAYFVEGLEPSLIVQLGYVKRASSSGLPARAVARWDLRGKRFCGPALPGALTGGAPAGDAVVIDGRVYRIGACVAEHGFDATEISDAVAVSPGATRWVARDGDALELRAVQQEATALPVATGPGRASGASASTPTQIAFSPGGDQLFVKTATSLCKWSIHDDDGALDLEGCRWSTAGWASDAAWRASDKSGETIVIFDRTADGAALRSFFGSVETEVPAETGGDVACKAIPRSTESSSAVLQQWEERLGHRFKDQGAPLQDTSEMLSPEIVPMEAAVR